jgi:hypothetical protein
VALSHAVAQLMQSANASLRNFFMSVGQSLAGCLWELLDHRSTMLGCSN